MKKIKTKLNKSNIILIINKKKYIFKLATYLNRYSYQILNGTKLQIDNIIIFHYIWLNNGKSIPIHDNIIEINNKYYLNNDKDFIDQLKIED